MISRVLLLSGLIGGLGSTYLPKDVKPMTAQEIRDNGKKKSISHLCDKKKKSKKVKQLCDEWGRQ
jgi:hypothetical protein